MLMVNLKEFSRMIILMNYNLRKRIISTQKILFEISLLKLKIKGSPYASMTNEKILPFPLLNAIIMLQYSF